MATTHVYRIIRNGRGLAIRITCEVHNEFNLKDDRNIRVVDNVYFVSVVNRLQLTTDEINYCIQGLKVASAKLSTVFRYPILFVLHDLEFDEVDYKPEALIYAVIEWLNKEFELDIIPPESREDII